MRNASLWLVSLALVVSGCATGGRGPTPAPFPRPTGSPPSAGRPAPGGSAMVDTALSLRGTPYRDGGADPTGFDCSGLVHYVFSQHGLSVPRVVVDLFQTGAAVDLEDLEPGDLLFFTTIAPGASHVGIAIGGREFVHAPSAQGLVRVESLDAAYWQTRYIGAKRILLAP